MNSYWLNDGIETINLRFGNLYGVGLYTPWYAVIPKFVKQALDGEKMTIYGDGEASRDYVHIEDITSAIIKSITTKNIGGETFNVGGETITVNQVAKIILEETEQSHRNNIKDDKYLRLDWVKLENLVMIYRK